MKFRRRDETKDAEVIFDEGTMTERNSNMTGIVRTDGEGTRRDGDPFWAGRPDIVGYFKGFATKQMHEANAIHTQN